MSRRVVGLVALLLVGLLGLAAPAGAGLISAPMLNQYATTVTVPVTIDPDNPGQLSIGKVVGETKMLDATLDKVLGRESFMPVIATAPQSGLAAPSGEEFNCQVDESTPGLTVYEPLYSEHSTNKYYMSWLMALYSQRAARIVAGQGATFQVEECTAGGADAKNGFRATKSGAAVAYKDTKPAWLGFNWAKGFNLSAASASHTFQTLVLPVTVTGSVEIAPAASQNTGTKGNGPVATSLDPFAVNEANGWWQSACSNVASCGSAQWEGSVVHGLWEFPEALEHPLTFAMVPWIVYHCGNSSGVCN